MARARRARVWTRARSVPVVARAPSLAPARGRARSSDPSAARRCAPRPEAGRGARPAARCRRSARHVTITSPSRAPGGISPCSVEQGQGRAPVRGDRDAGFEQPLRALAGQEREREPGDVERERRAVSVECLGEVGILVGRAHHAHPAPGRRALDPRRRTRAGRSEVALGERACWNVGVLAHRPRLATRAGARRPARRAGARATLLRLLRRAACATRSGGRAATAARRRACSAASASSSSASSAGNAFDAMGCDARAPPIAVATAPPSRVVRVVPGKADANRHREERDGCG